MTGKPNAIRYDKRSKHGLIPEVSETGCLRAGEPANHPDAQTRGRRGLQQPNYSRPAAPRTGLKRVQDVGLLAADDPSVLEWAAEEGRVLLTHDVTTMKKHARISAGLPMPGVFEIAQGLAIGVAIEEILLLVECSLEGEWEGQVRFLPLM